ncbi:hypothetical protein SAMN05519103_00535 [Rhizobiales bacterium GAS113]|nr:hypothetical protein SAMN05519103_00535 [Rhizobiales bacterium GAS113]
MAGGQTPGSFSKNFAWGHTGLRKLHESIRLGFADVLEPVSRKLWRSQSQIDNPGLDLIPVNFFLHNAAGQLTVDELVYQAVSQPYSLRFDRLALFAFNLSQVGRPPLKGPGRPAAWANEFVKEALWQNGVWRRSALAKPAMGAFLKTHIKGQSYWKCQTNYRRLFGLCGYLTGTSPTVNSGAADCQSAWKKDPVSAPKRDPSRRRARRIDPARGAGRGCAARRDRCPVGRSVWVQARFLKRQLSLPVSTISQ